MHGINSYLLFIEQTACKIYFSKNKHLKLVILLKMSIPFCIMVKPCNTQSNSKVTKAALNSFTTRRYVNIKDIFEFDENEVN